jgi:hypothetical protein
VKLKLTLVWSLVAASLPAAAYAAPAGLSIKQDMPLRFGNFVVFDRGGRTVSATGSVIDDNVFPVGRGGTGPAQFTVTYDRGSDDTREISISYVIQLGAISQFGKGGLSGTLSNFEIDVAGYGQLGTGRAVVQTIANCSSRICMATFHVGARLDLTRAGGSTALTIPLPISATLVSVQSL